MDQKNCFKPLFKKKKKSSFSHRACLAWTKLNKTSVSLPDFNVPNQVQTGTSGGEPFFQRQQVKTHFYTFQLFSNNTAGHFLIDVAMQVNEI